MGKKRIAVQAIYTSDLVHKAENTKIEDIKKKISYDAKYKETATGPEPTTTYFINKLFGQTGQMILINFEAQYLMKD